MHAIALLVASLVFVGPLPRPDAVSVRKGLVYANPDGKPLALDLYRPARSKERAPLWIITNGVFGADMRNQAMFEGWSRAATAYGFAAVVADNRGDHVTEDFDAMTSYLSAHAAELGVDAERIVVWAGSSNVQFGLPIVQDARRTNIKAAVVYYGDGEVKHFRLDVPLLVVRSGLDQDALNLRIEQMMAAAMRANAPWTLLNDPEGHHAFDVVDDNDLSRSIIDQTFRFAQAAVTKNYQASLHAGLPEASAVVSLNNRDYAQAVSQYAPLVAANPTAVRVLLAYGQALLGNKEYRKAIEQFNRIRDLGRGAGIGPRDLGLPAARACALAGDADAAVAWLAAIPARGRPASMQTDPDFASLRDRADFRALFAPQ